MSASRLPLAFFGSLAFAALTHAQPAFPPGPPPKPAYPADLQPQLANLAYADTHAQQTLDIFLPAGPGPFPWVLNLHGGGFRFGSKEMLDAALARRWLAAGVAVASINYRLSDIAPFPAALEDANQALRFLQQHAARYRLDAQRVLVFGQSAGGNLASMLGVGADPQHPGQSQPVRVAGVIDWFGPSDFPALDADARAQGCAPSEQQHQQADSFESRYLGQPLAQNAERARAASPLSYVRPGLPPFLLQKGRADCAVPYAQSARFAQALAAAGIPVVFDTFEDAGHGDTPGQLHFTHPDNLNHLLEWSLNLLRPGSGQDGVSAGSKRL